MRNDRKQGCGWEAIILAQAGDNGAHIRVLTVKAEKGRQMREML